MDMPWGLAAVAISQGLMLGAANQTGGMTPMETVGWGLAVKIREGTTRAGLGATPVFPVEPVQPQKL